MILVINLHDTKTWSVVAVYGSCSDCDFCTRFNVGVHEGTEVHLVKLVTRKNYIMCWFLCLKVNEILSNSICSSFVPAWMFKCLFCSKNFYEAARKTVKIVGISNVQVQRSRVELGQKVNLLEAGIDAVWKWEIDNAIFGRKAHSRFSHLLS